MAYLSHLMSVSALVMENGGKEDEAIAALLHDAIEDRGNAYESPYLVEPRTGRDALKRDIELQFGAVVLSIVRQCTDDEYLPAGRPSEKGSPAEWRTRKSAYLESLRKKTDVEQLWYYEGLADAFAARSLALEDAGLERLARQLAATVAAIGRHQPD